MTKRMDDAALEAARRNASAALDLDCSCEDPQGHEPGCFEHEAETAFNALVTDHDRARRVEQEQAETIKALADALISVRAQLPERVLDDGIVGSLSVRDEIDAALHLTGRLP